MLYAETRIAALEAENEELACALQDRAGYTVFLHEYTAELHTINAAAINDNDRLREQCKRWEAAWDEVREQILHTAWLNHDCKDYFEVKHIIDGLDPRKEKG